MKRIWDYPLLWGKIRKLASIISRSGFGGSFKGGKKNCYLKRVEKCSSKRWSKLYLPRQ